MSTIKVVRTVDAGWPSPARPGDGWGIEGDAIDGGPCEGEVVVTSSFDQPRSNGLGYHGGLDKCPWRDGRTKRIEAKVSGPLLWYQRWNGIPGPGGSYGNAVLQGHDDGESELCAHLESFAPEIEAWIANGARAEERPYLEVGDLIGMMGNTGNVWGTRPDGTQGPPVDAADRETGKHLHWEWRLSQAAGGTLVDPVTRMEFVSVLDQPSPDQPEPPAQPEHPTPNTPLELGPVQALAEARLFYVLAASLQAYPIAYDEAIDALSREAYELVAAFGSTPAIAEAQALGGLLDVYAANPVPYEDMIAAVMREAAEIIAVLQNAVPASE